MPRELRQSGVGTTYVYENGELVGILNGDRVDDPVLKNESIPIQLDFDKGEYDLRNPEPFFNNLAKRQAINLASSLPFAAGGRGAGALLTKLASSMGLSGSLDKFFNPKKPSDQIVGEAALRSGISGLASGLQTHDVQFHPRVQAGASRWGRIFAWMDPRGISFPYKKEIVQESMRVPKNTVVEIPPPDPSTGVNLPMGWTINYAKPVSPAQYKGGQITPKGPVLRDIKVPGWKKAGAGQVANTLLDVIPLLDEYFR